MQLTIDTLQAVPVSTIIPSEWKGWIWSLLSEDAPFSWGDNNHTLVDPLDFWDHLENVLTLDNEELVESEEGQFVKETLRYMSNKRIYVDLEG